MCDNKKIQQDIVKTLKNVEESVLECNIIYARIKSATVASQKKTDEHDLKHAVDKLERLSFQVIKLESSADLKTKTSINQAIKRIKDEISMYRSIEKREESEPDMAAEVESIVNNTILKKQGFAENYEQEEEVQDNFVEQIEIESSVGIDQPEFQSKNMRNDLGIFMSNDDRFSSKPNRKSFEDSVPDPDQENVCNENETWVQKYCSLEAHSLLSEACTTDKPNRLDYLSFNEVTIVEAFRSLPLEMQNIVGILESSLNNPIRMSDRQRYVTPPHSAFCESWVEEPLNFPENPLEWCIKPEFFRTITTELLFWIFYNQTGSYQQLVSIRELKARHWMFHKEKGIWIRLLELMPMTIGTTPKSYQYFDFNGTWKCKKLEEVEFENADFDYLIPPATGDASAWNDDYAERHAEGGNEGDSWWMNQRARCGIEREDSWRVKQRVDSSTEAGNVWRAKPNNNCYSSTWPTMIFENNNQILDAERMRYLRLMLSTTNSPYDQNQENKWNQQNI